MDAIYRLDWTLKRGERTTVVLPPFIGFSTGNPWDFSGAVLVLSWKSLLTPALSISSMPGPNGQVFSAPGTVWWELTPAGAEVLAPYGALFTHLLNMTCADGTPYPLAVGPSNLAPAG